jgi:hypothetical protein
MGTSHLHCFGESNLVTSQTSGMCDATDPNMIAYRRAVDQVGGHFAGYIIEWIDRRKKEEAVALSRLGSKWQPPPLGVFLDILNRPSVMPPKEIDIAKLPPLDSALTAVVEETGD